MGKVFILGIDGATPQLVFEKWLDYLPNIKSMLGHAIYGTMASSIPPSTIIAWTSMLSGKDPSFSNVYSYTYKDKNNSLRLTTSAQVRSKRIWKYLDALGKKSILLSVPLTYPVEPLNGIMLSCFLTPSFNDKSVYPLSLREEIIHALKQDYIFDVNVGLAGYKDLDSEEMIEKVYKMTDLQFKLIKDFIKSKDWDFFMSVLIGSDRMQHTMWRFQDPTHRRYPGKTKYENSIKDYFVYIDQEIGRIKALLDDDTYFIIVSDHGFDKMEGRINLNDWLIQENYLVLKAPVNGLTKLDFKNVDWVKTKAYAIGAYFGRIFFNKKSRDPENGVLNDFEVQAMQQELCQKLKQLKNDRGEEMQTTFYLPQQYYKGPYGEESPDLYVYFDYLRWGINNDVGNDGLYSNRTTKGSDDAGHAPVGIFMVHHPLIASQQKGPIQIVDIFPTIFKCMGFPIPEGLPGKPII